MKILVLADCESKSLYEYFKPEKIEGVELILACGDLKQNYLDFFASIREHFLRPSFHLLPNAVSQVFERAILRVSNIGGHS